MISMILMNNYKRNKKHLGITIVFEILRISRKIRSSYTINK